MTSNIERRFCRVTLDAGHADGKPILLTVTGPNPILLSKDGKFITMTDVKKDKEHFFNIDHVVHIQIEEERPTE